MALDDCTHLNVLFLSPSDNILWRFFDVGSAPVSIQCSE